MNIRTFQDDVKAKLAEMKADAGYNNELKVWEAAYTCKQVSVAAFNGQTDATELHAALIMAIQTIDEIQEYQGKLSVEIRQVLNREFSMKVKP